MNILQVTKGALMGGGERHVLTLLEGFKSQGVRTHLAVFTEGRLAETARGLGVDVHVLPKRFRGDIRPLTGLINLVRKKKIDIVHTHLVSGNLYGRLAGKVAGVKGIVTTLHHSRKEALGNFALPFMANLFFRGDIFMGRLSDRMISPSADLKRLLIDHDLDPARITVIPNAINMDKTKVSDDEMDACRRELRIPPGMKIVGMVGRLVEVKNFDLFIQAARKVLGQNPKVLFLIVGDGPLRHKLEKQAADSGIKERIIFTGFRDDVFRLIAMMDLFVLCSTSETNPIALMEAMASGKPVIATDVGGVSELIDHHITGWLCPSGDLACLTEAMIHLLSHPEQAKEIGARAREKMQKTYSLETITAQLLEVYQNLIDARTG